jgi:AcrR family transcriptional regulator
VNLRDRIISESLRLFSLKGFLSTSTQDILQAAHTSKGGLYNHFKSKEDLLSAVLHEARKIWRENNLAGLEGIEKPVQKLKKLLENYKDRYLKDEENLPGGCIFITLSVELDDQRPHLTQEITQGCRNLKAMIKNLLDEGKAVGEIRRDIDTEAVAEMIFSCTMGASINYSSQKSDEKLDQTVNALIEYIDGLR